MLEEVKVTIDDNHEITMDIEVEDKLTVNINDIDKEVVVNIIDSENIVMNVDGNQVYPTWTIPPEDTVFSCYSVSTEELNIREKASTNSGVLGILYKDTEVKGIYKNPANSAYTWLDLGFGFCAVKHIPTGTIYMTTCEGDVTPPPEDDLKPVDLQGDIRIVEKELGYSFKVGDEPWSAYAKIGANIRSGAVATMHLQQFWYKEGGFYVSIPDDEYNKMLDLLNNNDWESKGKPINAAIVRVYVPHLELNHDLATLSIILGSFLDKLHERNMRALLVWNDALRYHHNYVTEEAFHTLEYGLLNESYWLNQIYKGEMSNTIREILPKIRNHPAIFGHQLWNEPLANQSMDIVTAFKIACKHMSELIWSIDKKHPIGVGLISSLHITPVGASYHQVSDFFYGDDPIVGFLDKIHFVSNHMYPVQDATNEAQSWEHQDVHYYDLLQVAPRYGRPAIVDEIMTWRRTDNPAFLTTKQIEIRLTELYQNGLYAALIWGFHFGNMDHRLGGNAREWDNIFHEAFDDHRALFAYYGHDYLPSLG